MGLSSRRSSKRSGSAELPSLLEQHLPQRARTLLSPLSDDDREVLTYMLAFGLHLQMLAGVVFPIQQPQQKSSSAAKVGLKCEVKFPSQSFPFLSSKSRSRTGKASSLLAHKASCSCDCFSCYSSFWSRWAASSNRDLLSTIIEITEMAEEEEDRKAQTGKENTKKQLKKHVLGKGKKIKGEKWKLQGTQDTSNYSVLSPPMPKMADSMPATQSRGDVSVCAPMDVMYDASRDNVRMDEALRIPVQAMGDAVVVMEVTDRLNLGLDSKDASARSAFGIGKPSRVDPFAYGSASPVALFGQGRTSAGMESEVVETCSAQALPGDVLQGKNSLRLHCTIKRKSNQILPLDIEGTFIVKDDDEELGQLSEGGEGCASPRVVGASTRDRGVLSQVFPHTLCDIASRLWDLVSLGPRGHMMEY